MTGLIRTLGTGLARKRLAEPIPGRHAGSVHRGDGRSDAVNRRYLPRLRLRRTPIRPPFTYIAPVRYRWSFEDGPTRQLEGLSTAVARDMPHRLVSRDLGIREDQF